jgi:hypothetical protein
MKTARIAALGAGIVFAAATLLPGQTVVEAAKKEKERRESLGGVQGAVITNADLVRTKKKPAVIQPAGTEIPPGENPARPYAVALPSPRPAAVQPSPDVKAEQAKLFEKEKSDIEGRLRTAQEYVSLLKLKMAALQQQFYNFSNTTSREQIQKEISETYQKIQAAGAEEAKIKAELDNHGTSGPTGLQPIIRR